MAGDAQLSMWGWGCMGPQGLRMFLDGNAWLLVSGMYLDGDAHLPVFGDVLRWQFTGLGVCDVPG